MNKRPLITILLVGTICMGFGFGLSNLLNNNTPNGSFPGNSASVEKFLDQNRLTVKQSVPECVEQMTSTTKSVNGAGQVDHKQNVPSTERRSKLQERRKLLEVGGMHRYSDFFIEMKYSDDQIATFMDLWVRNGIEWIEREEDIPKDMEALTDEEKLTIQAHRQALRDEMENRFDADLLDHFPNDYYRHKEYTASLTERREIKVLTQSFAEPLDNYTRERLIGILYEEGTNVGLSRQRYFLDSADRLRYRKETNTVKDLREKEFLNRARSYLTSGQYEALKRKMEIIRKQRQLDNQLRKLNRELLEPELTSR